MMLSKIQIESNSEEISFGVRKFCSEVFVNEASEECMKIAKTFQESDTMNYSNLAFVGEVREK